jgi:hypothetical protein
MASPLGSVAASAPQDNFDKCEDHSALAPHK